MPTETWSKKRERQYQHVKESERKAGSLEGQSPKRSPRAP